MRVILIFFILIWSLYLFAQKAGINGTSPNSMFTVWGNTDTVLNIENYFDKPLMKILPDKRVIIGEKPSFGLFTLGNSFNNDQLLIRPKNGFGASYMAFKNTQVSNKQWNVTAFTFPSFPASAYFQIGHTENTNVLYMLGSGRIGIGNSPLMNTTLSIDGNIKFNGGFRVNGDAGRQGDVLQYTGSGTPPQWVSFTNPEFLATKVISIDPTSIYIEHGSSSNQYVFTTQSVNLPSLAKAVDFSFSIPVKGNNCLLCGTARGYIEIACIPVAGFPSTILDQFGNVRPYPQNDHYQHFYFTVNNNKIQTVTGSGGINLSQYHTSGPHNLIIKIYSYEGLYRLGTLNIPETSVSDYFFKYKINTQ